MVEGKENLHKVVPDGVFRYGSVLALGLLDDGGEVATTAVFHEDVEDAGVAVDIAVVVSDDVLVVQIFQDPSVAWRA